MTTPLLIGNSVEIELRNIMNYFKVGAKARYQGFEGYINFIHDDYITLCIAEQPLEDPYSRNGKTQCCICIFPHQWEDLEMEPIKQYSKPTVGETNDHPGNELLPTIEQR